MNLRLILIAASAALVLPACSSTTAKRLFHDPLIGHLPASSPVDVEHYRLELDLYPAEERIAGRCRIDFTLVPGASDALASVTFDLEGLAVDSVCDANGSSLSFTCDDGRLEIELDSPLEPGKSTSVEVRYGGRPSKGLWFTGARSDGYPTQVFTQGECEDARWWFPCQDFPADRATSELIVHMPVSWTSVAAGELVSREDDGGFRTDTWRMDFAYPTYLTTLVAGEFSVVNDEWRGVPLSYLSSSDYASMMGPSLVTATEDALAFLVEVTGTPYPYAKYSQACVDNFPFGGMENISATTLTDWSLKDELGLRDGSSTGLVVHEAAHQWFGDLMTCTDWPHIWLNEGFATYMTLAFFERSLGREEFLARNRDTLRGYLDGDLGENRRPIVHDVFRDPIDLFFGGHAYQGGASRLHLLRFVLGEENFWRGVQRYVEQNRGRSVHSDDLRRALEEVSGFDLTAFFDQWLYSPGYPEFECEWDFDEDAQEVELTVRQTQKGRAGTPLVFNVPMNVELRFGENAEVTRIQINARKTVVRLPAKERPSWVRFDKFGWLPARFDRRKQLSEWLLLAVEDDDVTGRLTALEALAGALQSASDPELHAIEGICLHALTEDSSAHVRRAVAETLAHFEGAAVRATLEHAASSDVDAAVRCACLAALEAVGVDEELSEFALEAFEDPYSWNVAGAAASLFASAAPDEAFEWIRAGLDVRSPHGVLRSRLLGELFQLDDRRSLPMLRQEAADPNKPDLSRIAAVGLLGHIDRDLSNVQKDLVRLLDDRNYQVRRAALAALESLGDTRAQGGLESLYERSVFPRERRAIERMLETFSAAR